MLKFNSCEGFHYICLALFRPCRWPLHHHSLVWSGVEALLPGEAVHATDDPGVHLRPLLAADLSPLASVFHLQEALGDGNPLPVRVRGPDPHVLHLHRRTLRHRTEEVFPFCHTRNKNNKSDLWKLTLVHLGTDVLSIHFFQMPASFNRWIEMNCSCSSGMNAPTCTAKDFTMSLRWTLHLSN